MTGPRIAIVCRDEGQRLRAAQAFDDAPLDWVVRLFEEPPPDADVVVRAPGVAGEGVELDLDHPQRTVDLIASRLGRATHGNVIEVTSSGGGTGCTSLALHLASYLSGDAPALYLETHPDRGGRLRLGLDAGGPSWAEVEDADSLAAASLPLVGGCRGLFAPSETDAVGEQIVEWGRAEFPYVVVDRGSEAPASDESRRIMLMTPSVPSARRVRSLLADGPSSVACVVVSNRLGPGSESTDEMLEAALEGWRITLALPCSPLLRDSEDRGKLLPRHASAWSRRVGRLADALSER